MSLDPIQWQAKENTQGAGRIDNRLFALLISLFGLLVIALVAQVYIWQNLSSQATQEESRLLHWQTLAAEYQALQGHKKTNWIHLPSVQHLQAWLSAQHSAAFKRFNITTKLSADKQNQEVLVLEIQSTDFSGFINWLYQIDASTNTLVESWDIKALGAPNKVSGQLVLRLTT